MVLSTRVLRACLIVAAVNLVVNLFMWKLKRASVRAGDSSESRRNDGRGGKISKTRFRHGETSCPLLGSCSSIQSYRLEYHYQGKSKINRSSILLNNLDWTTLQYRTKS